jgi:L-asparaginase II
MAITTEAQSPVREVLDFAGDKPLVAIMRGAFVGSLHRGTAAAVRADGEVVFALGNIEQSVFLRSAAKPFQVMPAILAGAIDRFGIEERELAVLCASHSGEPRHQEAVLSVLGKIGLDESALHCGVHPPLHEPTAADRQRRGIAPSPVCNNCSGAHAGMLAACVARGWPVDTYGAPDHPLQRETLQILAAFAALEPDEIAMAGDNCHVPAFRLPVRAAASAFARLATSSGVESRLRDAAARVTGAMTAYPEMVGGDDRFDTDLMRSCRGSLVAKGGAEGFQGIGTRSGIGLALKVSDGNARAIPPAVLRILSAFGAAPEDSALDGYREPEYRDREGEVVGRAVPIFGVDTPE